MPDGLEQLGVPTLPLDAVSPESVSDDYKIEDQPKEQEEDTLYQSKLNLTPEQEQEIIIFCESNIEEIEREREENGFEQRDAEYDNQFWGNVSDDSETIFNTHVHLTYNHCTKVENRIYQAFFESDPVFAVSMRPGQAKAPGDVASLQEQYLDYEIDTEIIIKSPMSKAFHEATLKEGGIVKLIYEKDTELVRSKEYYPATPEGIAAFLTKYPKAPEKHAKYLKRLQAGEDISIIVYKPETVYEAPKFYHVKFKDFYISLKTQGIAGLRKSRFFAEKQVYSWSELEEEVEEKRFDEDKVNELKFVTDKEGKMSLDPNYVGEEYEIFECNLFYKTKESERPKRIIVWYARDRKVILSAIHFPYDHGRPCYVPFWITDKEDGWLQPGLGKVLQPQNVIANAVTNFTLDKAFKQLMPLIRVSPNSPVAQQMLAKTWKVGDPIVAEQGQAEAFSLNVGGFAELMSLLQFNSRVAEESTGVSSAYLTGKADPVDPDAPAKKTTALLNETNINIKGYILCLLPSFQELGYQLLQLFGQYRESDEFTKKYGNVMGEQPVMKISADQLKFRTNLIPNAYMFEPDKVNEKRLNMTLAQFLTSNPFAANFLQKSPQSMWNLIRMLIKSWSLQHSNKVNEIWPTEQEVQQQLVNTQKEAMSQVLQEREAQMQQQLQARMMGQGAPVQGMGTPNMGAPMVNQQEGGMNV